jgi:hypothetical protein
MRVFKVMKFIRTPRFFAYVFVAAVGLLASGSLAGCSGGSTPALPSSQSNANTQSAQPPVGDAVTANAVWRDSVMRTQLPSAGCFQASYPSMTWERIACDTPPHLLYPLTLGAQSTASDSLPREATSSGSNTVGDGNDYTAATTAVMSSAIGSFPTVTGVTSVTSTPNPAFGDDCECGKNSYTLQLNSSFFSSAACNGESNCAGWEQFVYENPTGSSKGSLFIQDWLIPANLTGSIKCPRGKGWESADGGCVQNSPSSVSIPNIAIANLGELKETGDAATSGDSVYLAVGSTVYGMKNVQSDGITDLASNWKGAEFNIVGNAGGSVAEFNAGSSVTVSLQTDTGNTSAPACDADSGTTGESSNLSFVAAPSPTELTYPSILFKESNVSGGGTASCDAIPAI